jgi:colanic acid biosynthesis glycosyl transferase WcaI
VEEVLIMRILVVTQYFWPENFRINDLVEEFVKRGHQVTILTGKPNYPSGTLFPEYQQDPKAFNEYQGCRVVRVPIVMRGQGSGIKLVTNYLSYIMSASLLGYWKLRKDTFDIVFVYEPSPVTVCLPAIFFKKMKGVPVVFWVLDLWPETLEAIGVVKSAKVLSVVGKLVSFIYNRCDLVLGQSKAFYDGIARYCSDKQKIRYFPSWSESVFADSSVQPIEIMQSYDGFKVLFAGNVGEAQDFPAIIASSKQLKATQAKAKFFIVGDGRYSAWVEQEIHDQNLEDYVILLGRHPLEAMPSFYAAADALLVTLKESQAFAMTIPGKVQSYMAAGKPILTMLTGEGSRVVSEAECGLVADSGDANTLAANIQKMSAMSREELTSLGSNARNYAAREFDRDRLISQLESWFVEVVDATQKEQL